MRDDLADVLHGDVGKAFGALGGRAKDLFALVEGAFEEALLESIDFMTCPTPLPEATV